MGGLLPISGDVPVFCRCFASSARNDSARSNTDFSSPGLQGFATKSVAPRVRAWRALLSSLWPESTTILISGDILISSEISAKPSSGRCGNGGRPRSTSASSGAWRSCRSKPAQCCREWLVTTSKLGLSDKLRVSEISGSSSTISRSGFSCRDGFGMLVMKSLSSFRKGRFSYYSTIV